MPPQLAQQANQQPAAEAVDYPRGKRAAAPEPEQEMAPPPLEQVRRTPGASLAPQLSMNATSGEMPTFGGGMAPPPAGTDSGGLFGLAARTPKFEPELATQSQSLFLPKRKRADADPATEAAEQQGFEQQGFEQPAEPQRPGLPTLPRAYDRAGEPTEPNPMPQAPEPEVQSFEQQRFEPQAAPQVPEPQSFEPQGFEPQAPAARIQQDPQAFEPRTFEPQGFEPQGFEPQGFEPSRFEQQAPAQDFEPLPPLPERGAGGRATTGEQPFADPMPPAAAVLPGEATREAMPPVEPRRQEPVRADETQVAMSPGFDQAADASGGTRPREEFEQFAPPAPQFGAPEPEATTANPYADRYDAAPQDQGYSAETAYAPLAPQIEPEQQWSSSSYEPSYEQPFQPSYEKPYDQSYGQPYEQSHGQPQDQFVTPYEDPYARDAYSDATLVGQPPVGPDTPAPPPMAPQGYDPYGSSYDAHYESPRRGPAGIDLKRWGLIVLAVAVVVAIIALVVGVLNNNDDAKADTAAGQGAGAGAGGGAQAQAEKIDELIKVSAKDKAAIGAAQVDLQACQNIEEAIKTFEDAAVSRQNLAKEVAKVDTAVLPGSRKLVKNLETAWLTAQNADLAFAAWGEKRKVNAAGDCVGGKRKLEKATTLSLASHDPKKAAAKAWGPIAEKYGLESVEWKKL